MFKKDIAYRVLKWSLALVFIWFGLLKLFDVSPVKDVVFSATPFLRFMPFGWPGLALLEVLIGVGLFFKRTAFVSAVIIIIHLLIASLSVLFNGMAWMPQFPLLTLAGEFVIKNGVLIAAAWVIASLERKI